MKIKPLAVALAGIAAAVLVVVFIPDVRPKVRKQFHRHDSWSDYDFLKVDEAGFIEKGIKAGELEKWLRRRDRPDRRKKTWNQPTMERKPRFFSIPSEGG